MHLVDLRWRHLIDVVTVAVIHSDIQCCWIVVVSFPETKEVRISVLTRKYSSKWNIFQFQFENVYSRRKKISKGGSQQTDTPAQLTYKGLTKNQVL